MTTPTSVPGSSRERRRARSTVLLPVALLSVGAALCLGGSAQAAGGVPLGAATRFAAMSGSGITNGGQTLIRGDVGSTPTSTETGFAACPAPNCVTVKGTNHTVPGLNDATTRSARRAATSAYAALSARQATPVPAELGGVTYRAGTYASGSLDITGTLVLDARNDPGAVFVFRSTRSLVTSAVANVKLVNGAQAANVFWVVGSAVTLGASSHLAGSVLAHDSITVGDAVRVSGRLFAGEQPSGVGALTLSHDVISRPTS